VKWHALEGAWRITAMPDLVEEYLEEGEHEPKLVLARKGRDWNGEFEAGYMSLGLFGYLDPADPERLLFTFDGLDEHHQVAGLGFVAATGDDARGEVWFHGGDRYRFEARRE